MAFVWYIESPFFALLRADPEIPIEEGTIPGIFSNTTTQDRSSNGERSVTANSSTETTTAANSDDGTSVEVFLTVGGAVAITVVAVVATLLVVVAVFALKRRACKRKVMEPPPSAGTHSTRPSISSSMPRMTISLLPSSTTKQAANTTTTTTDRNRHEAYLLCGSSSSSNTYNTRVANDNSTKRISETSRVYETPYFAFGRQLISSTSGGSTDATVHADSDEIMPHAYIQQTRVDTDDFDDATNPYTAASASSGICNSDSSNRGMSMSQNLAYGAKIATTGDAGQRDFDNATNPYTAPSTSSGICNSDSSNRGMLMSQNLAYGAKIATTGDAGQQQQRDFDDATNPYTAPSTSSGICNSDSSNRGMLMSQNLAYGAKIATTGDAGQQQRDFDDATNPYTAPSTSSGICSSNRGMLMSQNLAYGAKIATTGDAGQQRQRDFGDATNPYTVASGICNSDSSNRGMSMSQNLAYGAKIATTGDAGQQQQQQRDGNTTVTVTIDRGSPGRIGAVGTEQNRSGEHQYENTMNHRLSERDHHENENEGGKHEYLQII